MTKLFGSQTDDEKIYLIIRQHWIVLVMRIAFIGLVFIMLTILWWWTPILLPKIFIREVSLVFDFLYFSTLLVSLYGSLLVGVLYYLNLQIITDMRMVDVDQHSLFKRNVSELFIENVEEPTSFSRGFLPTLLSYGDVAVQTSGSKIEFVFERIPHPEMVKKLILDLYERRISKIGSYHQSPAKN